jgi:tRNA A-37 threonylcarbamoyl transferase component Bud32
MTAFCAHCQAPLAPDVLEGLCPRCLLGPALNLERAEQPATTPPAGFIPPAIAELAPLFPQLEILELLGQGGMGAVYKARQIKLDRLVALKVLPPTAANDPSFAERFLREARTLARLNHPSIVGVHDFGDVNGLFYLIMEFVEGVNLRQAMAAGKLEPRQALPLVCELCSAMQYAHEMGVVHRDIKPENILLDRQGRVKVADFGLAKLVGQSRPMARLTATRQAMGTPHYMAPEQWEKPLEVDHRADVYSLGVVFYELLTGELPLGKFAMPSEKSGVDVRLDSVVLRAMEKQPEQRFQKMSEMKTAVEEAGQPQSSLPKEDPLKPFASCFGAAAVAFGITIFVMALLPLLNINPLPLAPLLVLLGLLLIVLIVAMWVTTQSSPPGVADADAEGVGEAVPGLSAQEEGLRRVLLPFEGELAHCLSVLPNIDSTVLGTARKRCRVPPEDRILAVLDISGGEGEFGLLFGCSALYWRNEDETPHPGTAALRYAELSGRRLVNHGDAIYLGNDQFLYPKPDDTGIDCEVVVSVLNKVREAMANFSGEPGASATGVRGDSSGR